MHQLFLTSTLAFSIIANAYAADSFAYVSNRKSNSVSLIDAEGLLLMRVVPVGLAPWGVVAR